MENEYVVTADIQMDGLHFLHRSDCQVLPSDVDLLSLGAHEACEPAMAQARERVNPVEGCAMCCPDCHTPTDGPEG